MLKARSFQNFESSERSKLRHLSSFQNFESNCWRNFERLAFKKLSIRLRVENELLKFRLVGAVYAKEGDFCHSFSAVLMAELFLSWMAQSASGQGGLEALHEGG